MWKLKLYQRLKLLIWISFQRLKNMHKTSSIHKKFTEPISIHCVPLDTFAVCQSCVKTCFAKHQCCTVLWECERWTEHGTRTRLVDEILRGIYIYTEQKYLFFSPHCWKWFSPSTGAAHLQSECDKKDPVISVSGSFHVNTTSIGSMDYLALVTWSGFTSYHSIKYRL